MAVVPSEPQVFLMAIHRVHSSDRMAICSTFRDALLISSAVMLPGMAMHDSIALMVMHIPGISLSMFVSYLCLDRQSVRISCAQAFTAFLCSINAYIIAFFEACVVGLNRLS